MEEFCIAAAGAFSKLRALPLHPTQDVVSHPSKPRRPAAAACSLPAWPMLPVLSIPRHKMSLRSWVWAGLHQPGVILREPLQNWDWRSWHREGTGSQRGVVGTDMGCGHAYGLWARLWDAAVILTAANGPAKRKGGPCSLLPGPRVGSISGCRVPGRCWVISGVQHWVCLGGTAPANVCQEQHRHSGPAWERPTALPALSVAGLHGAGEARLPQPMPREPVCCLKLRQAPMNLDQTDEDSAQTPKLFMHRPGGASTGACSTIPPMRGPLGLRYPPQGPPSSAGWTSPKYCYEGMGTLWGHPLALPKQ